MDELTKEARMRALSDQFEFSIRAVIRDHLDHVGDRDQAIELAAREIVELLSRPIVEPSHPIGILDANLLGSS